MKIFFVIIFIILIIGCRGKDVKNKVDLNSPPIINEANIAPQNPSAQVDIRIDIKGSDRDGDSINYSYKWIKNNEEIKGESKEVLKGSLLKKGDTLKCIIIPYDGKEYGKPFETGEIKVINSSPVIKSINILPFPPFKDSHLKVNVEAYDPDNDSVRLTYKWFKNDAEIFGEYENELNNVELKKGDKVFVEVTASDGESEERPYRSNNISISNTPPNIVSDPPGFFGNDNIYTYQVVAKDLDNDPLTYETISAPQGMTIDQNSGLISWNISEKDIGEVKVEVAAKDNDGGKGLQRFILKIGRPVPQK